MPDESLFTLRELADQLSLPESTIRYYRDAFLDHIPSVGTGRRRRYPEPALAVLRTIARGYASGRTRTEILGLIEGVAPAAASDPIAPPPKQPRRARVHDTTEVTNLDLLAAIVDGEREQREALWQMAQEVIRLTQVLESQEKVLGELSEHTGMQLKAPAPLSFLAADTGRPPALGQGATSEPWRTPPAPAAVAAPPLATAAAMPAAADATAVAVTPPAPPAAGAPTMPSWLADLSPSRLMEPLAMPEPEPAPTSALAALEPQAPTPAPAPAEPSDIERLRQELESERALVDRLREAKLKLEHRTAEAEEAAADTRSRRRTSVIGRLLGSDRSDP
jgi:DNA-binding transcriptional MerR regulator